MQAKIDLNPKIRKRLSIMDAIYFIVNDDTRRVINIKEIATEMCKPSEVLPAIQYLVDEGWITYNEGTGEGSIAHKGIVMSEAAIMNAPDR